MATEKQQQAIGHWLKTLELFNAQAVEEFLNCFTPDFTNFYLDNGLLIEGRIEASNLQQMYDAGYTPAVAPRHVDVTVLKDSAVLTGYLAGSITLTSGEIAEGPWRLTAVLVDNGDGWQIMHNHWSKLL